MITLNYKDFLSFFVSELPFKPPCSVRRMEMTFPHVVDVRQRHVTSRLPGDTTSERPEPTRDWFSLEVTWRRRKLKVVLFRTDLVTPLSFSEWSEGNETVSERLEARCFYHGYVQGQAASYVAVSTCLGVVSRGNTHEALSRANIISLRHIINMVLYVCMYMGRIQVFFFW